MQANQIIDLLQSAPISEIVTALQTTNHSHVRQVLCDLLGERHASEAVASLIDCLDDESTGVRSSAVDALAKIGDVAAGSALLAHYVHETNLPVKRMLAAALGAVQYQPAIPTLIVSLTDMDASLRGTAAWSLGHLKAQNAYEALCEALKQETSNYPIERMQAAIAIIKDLPIY